MNTQKYWSLRQNPRGITNQTQMREFIIDKNIVTCPFGHLNKERINVINGVYNEEDYTWKSKSQDRKFIEDMNIGDFIIIPFAGLKDCILAKIVSDQIYSINTGLFTTEVNNEINLVSHGTIPFRPVGRKIEIIGKYIRFEDKRTLSRNCLSHIKYPVKLSANILDPNMKEFIKNMFNSH